MSSEMSDCDMSSDTASPHHRLENKDVLQAAKDGDWAEISKQISEGFGVDDLIRDGESGEMSLLMASAINGRLECVQKLLALGATRGHINAMVQAAKKGHIECCCLLMRYTFSKAVGDNGVLNEVVKALQEGDFRAIKNIFELKGNGLKNIVNEWGGQLMNLLIVHGCPTFCLQILADLGVDLDCRCKSSVLTPLDWSVYSNNVACIRFLLLSGVDVNIDSVIYCKDDDCLRELITYLDKKPVMCFLNWITNVKKTSSMSILLKYLDDIDFKDQCGMTLLMWACYKNSLLWAEFLLKNGANVNFRSRRGDTALNIACYRGHSEIVELLLRHKVDINCQYEVESASPSAIFEVCAENMMRRLFDNSAQMGLCSPGENALIIACSQGHVTIVDLLLTHRVNVFAITPDGYNAVMAAAIGNHVKCIQKLVEKSFAPIDQRTRHGETALMQACSLGYDEVVDVLLKHRADVNAQDKKGKTPLMYAVLNKKSLKCAKLLLEQNAINIHLKNHKGRTALMVSCSSDNDEIVELLIQRGSDVNVQNVKGRTAVMYACVNESLTCAQKLLKQDVDLDVINEEGYSALMIACIRGHEEMAELMIKNKSSVNIQNDEGKSAIMFAAACSNINAAVNMIPKLVQSGADINMRTKSGGTALIYAVAKGNFELVELMVKCGADLNAKHEDGRTAIMFALGRQHNTSCVQTFVDLGADLDFVDNDGCTVFSLAIQGNHQTFRFLVDSGKLVDDNGLKPVHNESIMKNDQNSFIFANLTLAMERGLFNWGWCLVARWPQIVCHAAVVTGISPGWFELDGEILSPLFFLYSIEDFTSFSYLVSNLHFHTEDFRRISDYRATSILAFGSNFDAVVAEKLFDKPLSLKSWSFLVISDTISRSGPVNRRGDLVNRLPLPEGLKRTLKFETPVSRECLEELASQENVLAGDLVFTANVGAEIRDDANRYCLHCVNEIEGRY